MPSVANAPYIIGGKNTKPDSILVKDQLELLQQCYADWGIAKLAEYLIWIQGKEENKLSKAAGMHSRLIPFSFNPIQIDILSKATNKNICLKPRQVGLTTWFLLIRILLPTLITPGTNGFLISQNNEMAAKHFTMLKRAFRYIGATNPGYDAGNDFQHALHANLLHVRTSNKKELVLDQLDNFVMIGSAEVEEAGQGVTLHRVCCSEVARWPGKPEETLANLKEATVLNGTFDMESTANMAAGYFFEECLRAKTGNSDFTFHFHPWWYEPAYRIALTDKEKKELKDDLTNDEIQLRKLARLTLEQVAFRRAKKLSLRHNFEEKYPEDPLTAFLISGKGFFDTDILRIRRMELVNYEPFGQMSDGRVVFHKQPIATRSYVVGADPASGKTVTSEDTDFSAAKVLDIDTGMEVASYMARIAPEDFANDLADLGKYYNNAMIAVERGTAADSGGEGGSVLMTLINDCQYSNIYQHKEWLKAQKQTILLPGLPMTSKTRPIALNRFKFMLENDPEKIVDIRTIDQMLSFVRDERGRPAGASGTHDDMVMATAIAHYVRGVVLGYITPEFKREKYGVTPVEFAMEEEGE
jgi:hypothetical protein